MNLNTVRTWQASSVDEVRLAAAMREVFHRSDVIYSALYYERADGHYMQGAASLNGPSHIPLMGSNLAEKNSHPGLLLAKNQQTPFMISAENPEIASQYDAREWFQAIETENFSSVYFIPVRDFQGKLFVSSIASRQRKLRNFELRLIHSYCLEAVENVARDTETDGKPILTQRERDCLIAAANGFTEKQSAKMLSISHFTVHAHLENCKRKLGVRSKLEAVFKGLNLGDLFPADVEIN